MVSLPHPGFSTVPLLLFLLSEADTDKTVRVRVHDGTDPDGLPQTLSSFAA